MIRKVILIYKKRKNYKLREFHLYPLFKNKKGEIKSLINLILNKINIKYAYYDEKNLLIYSEDIKISEKLLDEINIFQYKQKMQIYAISLTIKYIYFFSENHKINENEVKKLLYKILL